jgi:beta-lactamase class A
MPHRSGRLPAAAAATLLCGVLVAGWTVVDHRRADAVATFAQPDATTPSPTSTVDDQPSAAAPTAPDPTATVAAALAAALAVRGSHVGIEVLDRVAGAAVGYQASLDFRTASVAKVDILATLLWQSERAGRELTADQRDLAEAMITESDNDAASALWDTIGDADGLAAANQAFGLTQTTPGEDGNWGSTVTTPADQVRLLAMLTDDSGPLSAGSRGYELGLMSSVESDQRWGIPAAAGSAASAVYVKDGWLSADTDNGLWRINSIGRIVEPGHDWLVAVLSDHHDDEDSGIALVQRAATLAVNGLR